MNKQLCVPISTGLFLELSEFLRSHGDARDPVEMVSLAVEYWLENASWKPELISESSTKGYQWKSLFLPDGTEIRMQYKGAYSYAKVDGDQIIFGGNPITPATLANTVANSSRNAWRDLWIKRPGEREWSLADECREEAKG